MCVINIDAIEDLYRAIFDIVAWRSYIQFVSDEVIFCGLIAGYVELE